MGARPTDTDARSNASRESDTPSLYADPMLYDILHTPGTADEVDALERIENDHARGAPATWLEPACGSGRYLRLAAKRGRRVLGFDLEPAMIAYAEDRSRRAGLGERSRYFVADMRDFIGSIDTGSVGLAFNLINTVRHLMTDRQVLRHFDGIARVLHRRGVYAVGISLTEYGLEPPSEDIWTAQRGRCRLTQIVQYLPPTDRGGDRVESVYSHLTVQRPGGEEHIPSSYGLRAYDLEQWQGLIARSAMEVAAVTDAFGRPAEPPRLGYGVWVLRPRER